ncbi:SCO family protein [Sphingomonas sinipercae]|uniref:SCO family protein n=1 Tax=Sphingomonas sinipercae TaxID=2714944 RepID=A0A6G7ZM88_9SPHN|nr:SCO family protein [Sphingomonas sinipercae]QIL02091.1 SCO family protein [Sphingomonas sinipercae]
MKRLRIVLWIAVAVAAVAGVLVATRGHEQQPMTISAASTPVGPFTLTDGNGQPFPSSKLAGKPYALFFGFTHCPDVCPTTLSRLIRLRKAVGRGEEAFNIVFVTVDPERDGAEEVGAYSKAFNSPVIGLTGSPAQIDGVKQQFGIFSQKVPTSGGDYTVDHTATVQLFDRDGQRAGTIAADEGDAPALDKLKMLVG